ncbi:cytochrome P450 [Marasmius fiardii PR-910]|nr:cytochrome P450 [Marasmius fiardii PR-910]
MEEVIKNCAGISFLDTTVSAILSFVLAMVLNPKVQVRAQKELEEVIESLPYISAIFSETLRWNPVLPLSLPHGVVNDDVYEGYLIPAGDATRPIFLQLAVLHDESIYGPDTTSFNPDRFMKQDGKDLPLNPELLAFGFGRRICPGRYFAINTVWLTITYLLTGFTMAKEVDEEGKEVDLVPGYTDEALRFAIVFELLVFCC